MKTFLVLVAMSSLLMAAQCNVQPSPAPAPPAPPPTVVIPTADAAPPPAPPSDDKCEAVLTLVRGEGCTLPNNWLEACRTARAHGATYHLKCFVEATDCTKVAACFDTAG